MAAYNTPMVLGHPEPGNEYSRYVEEKDPRDIYEVATDMTHPLAVTFLFTQPPNLKYWAKVIIPELERMAAKNNQTVFVQRDAASFQLVIEILPPGQKMPKEEKLRRRKRGW